MNLEDVQKIYFIGIGGIAMSAAACIAKEKGFEVAGSDEAKIYSPANEVLETNTVTVYLGYDAKNIEMFAPDLVVISAGIDPINPEIAWATAEGKELVSFPELLAAIAKDEIRIVVTGTHGKTTTAGALGHLLNSLDNSSFMTGGVLQKTDTNFKVGEGHYFVFEGDEYKSTFEDPTPKFHHYKPDILLLTNLEYDHPDIFENQQVLEDEFSYLIDNLPDDGVVVYNGDDGRLKALLHHARCHAFPFGTSEDADFRIISTRTEATGTHIEIANKTGTQFSKETYWTNLTGLVYVMDVVGAVALLRVIGFTPEIINHNLAGYFGIKRRLELVGTINDVHVFDDYAHHPTAVQATLESLHQRFPKNRIIAVFEPHTFSRTQALLTELSNSFASADKLYLAPIYPAREKANTNTIKNEEVFETIKNNFPDTVLINSKQEVLDLVKADLTEGDVIVVMAVGDFHELSHDLVKEIGNRK